MVCTGAADVCRDSDRVDGVDRVDTVRGAVGTELGRLSPMVIRVNSQVIPVAW